MRASLVLTIVVGLAACRSGTTGPTGLDCAGPYPDQASSLYVLPWPIGLAFVVDQGNCGAGSHGAGTLVEYAYDILMPIGTPVVASRAGRVLLVESRYPDGTRRAGEENYVNILHDDGTIAGYVHLTTGGVLVGVGGRVERGHVIGLSGDSGSSSQPHLHFHVQRCDGCATMPVTFLNTSPHPRGLRSGRSYVAEPY